MNLRPLCSLVVLHRWPLVHTNYCTLIDVYHHPYSSSAGVTLTVHVIQTLLHMLQVTMSFFLMLVAMTYNVWLFVAIVLGAGAGYFLFAKYRGPGTQSGQDANEHCH